ncbi:fructosamine kinase family protein [Catellatospora sp. KI3]|uniref:fructosamine kinase family protein n=1 Tax=Catellatospora sp. KI3 TaxID=3041620 RepID=UPI0024825B79|nr:fructosamine kinase family protein [Catellatospora sp. KI3]MDI1461717.1 fructosamine kinase family protein [Catellatospora sp. KI3]
MDLAYLRAHPHLLPTFLHHQRIRETPVDGGSICHTSRLTFDDGESVFAKSWPENTGAAPDGFFAAEAHGLRWLAEPEAVPVPEVLVETPELLGMAWVEHGSPTARGAEEFGRGLAALHRAGAPAFGAPWPGFHGSAPMDNTQVEGAWHEWYGRRRLAAYLKLSVDRGALEAADTARVERVLAGLDRIGADEPPARIHGDLWTGNLLWDADGRCWLVDPAAHGGHRETDLAYLGLWGGAPHLDRILAAYAEVSPLAEGWRERVPLHQLSMYLLHTALFGAAFAPGVRETTTACLGLTA